MHSLRLAPAVYFLMKRLRSALLMLTAAAMAACATAPPVQEMSDARQAIAAARDAGAAQYAGDDLERAEAALIAAERYLQDGISSSYWSARQSAVNAKEIAFEALLKSRSAGEGAGN